jgi:hypothetical protein
VCLQYLDSRGKQGSALAVAHGAKSGSCRFTREPETGLQIEPGVVDPDQGICR